MLLSQYVIYAERYGFMHCFCEQFLPYYQLFWIGNHT